MPRPRKNAAGSSSGGTASDALPEAFLAGFDETLPKTPQVYDILRRAIVTLVLTPGSVLNEKQICDKLGISRTPLREAILQLSSENLVSIVPHSGTYVARIDLQNVFDGQLVRDALEMKIVRLAATKMTPAFERKLDLNLHQQRLVAQQNDYDAYYLLDEEFHSTICEFAASRQIWRIVNDAKAQLDRVRRLAFPVPSHLGIVLQEHADIAAALKARDPDAAAEAMKLHLDRVFDTIRRLITERADYFSSVSSKELDEYEGALRGRHRTKQQQ